MKADGLSERCLQLRGLKDVCGWGVKNIKSRIDCMLYTQRQEIEPFQTESPSIV